MSTQSDLASLQSDCQDLLACLEVLGAVTPGLGNCKVVTGTNPAVTTWRFESPKVEEAGEAGRRKFKKVDVSTTVSISNAADSVGGGITAVTLADDSAGKKCSIVYGATSPCTFVLQKGAKGEKGGNKNPWEWENFEAGVTFFDGSARGITASTTGANVGISGITFELTILKIILGVSYMGLTGYSLSQRKWSKGFGASAGDIAANTHDIGLFYETSDAFSENKTQLTNDIRTLEQEIAMLKQNGPGNSVANK